jgi:hypothetical protein
LQTLDCRAGLQRFANVLFCAVGFLLSLRGGEKKQNKLPSICTDLFTKHQINKFFFLLINLLFQSIEFCLFTLAYNVLALGAVAGFGAQNCQYTTKVDARYNVQLTTSPAINATQCVRPA